MKAWLASIGSSSPVPPQTLGNLEEEQLIDSVSTLPSAGGSLGKSRAEWKTKHDSARGRCGTVNGWRGQAEGVEELSSFSDSSAVAHMQKSLSLPVPSLTTQRPENTAERPQVSINICCTRAGLPACYCVGELPPWVPAHPRPCYL